MTSQQPQCLLAPPAGQAAARQLAEREAIETETAAMAAAFTALQPLGEEARWRAVGWLARALDIPLRGWTRAGHDGEVPF
jgi:hypothetical protein